MRRAAWVLLGVYLFGAAPARAEQRTPGELAIESKLLAPCCWVQTLDMHESPLASELRLEIRTKLTQHVPAARIEAALVARYGERLWAIPPGHDPRMPLVNIGFGGLGIALAGLCLLAWRWSRREPSPPAAVGGRAARRDALDAQLDEALRRLEP